jgi:hypothetical protein
MHALQIKLTHEDKLNGKSDLKHYAANARL